MKLEHKETVYKGITIIHLFDGSGYIVKDIEKRMIVKASGLHDYEYKRLYGDAFRENRRHDSINHRFQKVFSSFKEVKACIDDYLEFSKRKDIIVLKRQLN